MLPRLWFHDYTFEHAFTGVGVTASVNSTAFPLQSESSTSLHRYTVIRRIPSALHLPARKMAHSLLSLRSFEPAGIVVPRD